MPMKYHSDFSLLIIIQFSLSNYIFFSNSMEKLVSYLGYLFPISFEKCLLYCDFLCIENNYLQIILPEYLLFVMLLMRKIQRDFEQKGFF